MLSTHGKIVRVVPLNGSYSHCVFKCKSVTNVQVGGKTISVTHYQREGRLNYSMH